MNYVKKYFSCELFFGLFLKLEIRDFMLYMNYVRAVEVRNNLIDFNKISTT